METARGPQSQSQYLQNIVIFLTNTHFLILMFCNGNTLFNEVKTRGRAATFYMGTYYFPSGLFIYHIVLLKINLAQRGPLFLF
jgi:hypothetical protein